MAEQDATTDDAVAATDAGTDPGGSASRRRFGRHLLAAGGAAVVATAAAGAVAPAAGAVGVSFNAITPYRSIDTRSFGLGPFPSGEPFDIDVWTDENGDPAIPQSAAAVTFNLTITETVGGGWLAVYPAGTSYPGVSNINWSGAVTIANGGTVALGTSADSGQGSVTVLAGGGGAAQFIIDVTGYYA